MEQTPPTTPRRRQASKSPEPPRVKTRVWRSFPQLLLAAMLRSDSEEDIKALMEDDQAPCKNKTCKNEKIGRKVI